MRADQQFPRAAASTVAYSFTLKGKDNTERHVTVYAAPGKLFDILAQVVKEFEVEKADVLAAREASSLARGERE